MRQNRSRGATLAAPSGLRDGTRQRRFALRPYSATKENAELSSAGILGFSIPASSTNAKGHPLVSLLESGGGGVKKQSLNNQLNKGNSFEKSDSKCPQGCPLDKWLSIDNHHDLIHEQR